MTVITMSTTATSTWKSPSHSHSHSRSSRPSTTPRGYSSATSVGQPMPPMLSPTSRTPTSSKKTNPQTPSPSYFGFVAGDDSIPPDSNPGYHARQNWEASQSSAQSSARATAPTQSRQMSMDQNPEFEAFRRQSEQYRFNLNHNVSGVSTPQTRTNSSSTLAGKKASAVSPTVASGFFDGYTLSKDKVKADPLEQSSFFEIPRHESPASMVPNSVADHQHARLSLPSSSLQTPPLDKTRQPVRSDTLPTTEQGVPIMISPQQFAQLFEKMPTEILLLDLRVYPQYATSRLHGALNLCIPTTLLKRPSFTVQKLADTFSNEVDRKEFAKWRDCRFIAVYDANSSLAKEAVVPINVLKKFATEGWKGQGLVIKGGFLAFSRALPNLLDHEVAGTKKDTSKQTLSISPPSQDALPVAGGCSMPSTKSAANPFFGNIRQNMDLLDGVGQIPIKMPSELSEQSERYLPSWLRITAKESNEGKLVAEKFLAIERSEQKRMQDALSCHVSYGTPGREAPKSIQVAGIEKGSKNRYNNIFPYEHTRVRLQNVRQGSCDYVNASHVKASYSNRRYISTQAPIPATFDDFWRVVWEQDSRVIVMLTAESEGGQIKAHPYWNPGEYGPLKLKKLSEKRVSLQCKESASRLTAVRRPSMGQRRSTNPIPMAEKKGQNQATKEDKELPSVIVRHFTLSHSSFPFQPMREITQLQYSQWPDFGAPAEPGALLELIEQMNKYVRSSTSPTSAVGSAEQPAPKGQRPIIVHCSAGCGRTGTFCTIDSVIDMLKRQLWERANVDQDAMEVDEDAGGDWVRRDDIDLVARAVDDFRHQRLSMVQNLRQFVLCYESILQWIVGQQGMRFGKQADRWSYHG